MNSPSDSKTANPLLKNLKWTEQQVNNSGYSMCTHYFEMVGQECKCVRCGLGLIGVFKTEDGKPIV